MQKNRAVLTQSGRHAPSSHKVFADPGPKAARVQLNADELLYLYEIDQIICA